MNGILDHRSTWFVLGFLCCQLVYWAHAQLAKRHRAKHQAGDGDGHGPQPLPMRLVKRGNSFVTKPGTWPVVAWQEKGHIVWVVVRYDELPPPPVADAFSQADKDAHAAIVAQGGAA